MPETARPTLGSLVDGRIAIEIGCTARTTPLLFGAAPQYLLDPVRPEGPLSEAGVRSLGSDFVRAGYLYERARGGELLDRLGANWLALDSEASPLAHPLKDASVANIQSYSRPKPLGLLQKADRSRGSVVVDAPLPGIMETCLVLRGAWDFLGDCVEKSQEAHALLDWAASNVAAAYETLLVDIGEEPDFIVYQDELGTDGNPYLSKVEFHSLIMPRIRRVFAAIRSKTNAPIVAYIRGASRQLLVSLVEEGVSILAIDGYARGMLISELRRLLGRSVTLHGVTNFVALGQALMAGDTKGVAILACEFAMSMPAIAAPKSPTAPELIPAISRASAFLSALDADDLSALARFGPDRQILARAALAEPRTFIDTSADVRWTTQGSPIALAVACADH